MRNERRLIYDTVLTDYGTVRTVVHNGIVVEIIKNGLYYIVKPIPHSLAFQNLKEKEINTMNKKIIQRIEQLFPERSQK
jgi:phosphopantetheine adenylyltransferase